MTDQSSHGFPPLLRPHRVPKGHNLDHPIAAAPWYLRAMLSSEPSSIGQYAGPQHSSESLLVRHQAVAVARPNPSVLLHRVQCRFPGAVSFPSAWSSVGTPETDHAGTSGA